MLHSRLLDDFFAANTSLLVKATKTARLHCAEPIQCRTELAQPMGMPSASLVLSTQCIPATGTIPGRSIDGHLFRPNRPLHRPILQEQGWRDVVSYEKGTLA